MLAPQACKFVHVDTVSPRHCVPEHRVWYHPADYTSHTHYLYIPTPRLCNHTLPLGPLTAYLTLYSLPRTYA